MKILIRLKRERMLYDIANNAFITAETMADGRQRHWTEDITESQNIDRVNRMLWLAYCRVGHLLRRWIRPLWNEPSADALADGHSACRQEYVFCLESHRPVDKATADYCSILIYEMMTATVIADWLQMTAPEKATVWENRREETADRLRRTVAHLHRCQGRPLAF